MSVSLTGACHCGAVRVSFAPSRPAAELQLRACQCGFCRRHGGLTASDPQGRMSIEASPGALSRYRFGRRLGDALVCEECGVYVGMTMETDAGLIGVINVRGIDLPAFAGREAEPQDYEHETDAERLARRKARWTPAVFVEAQPSA
jgi:hypothetical protein